MSLPIWTADALRSRTAGWEGVVWRIVEAQHAVSTRKLVDSLAEQELLENLIEKTKPCLPPECRDLHFLLATPFRYGQRAQPTRFRALGDPGVFYGSEKVETAVAEMVFYRLLFFAESPDTPWPDRALEHTAFCVRVKTRRAIDLTAPPFDREAILWMHPTDYAPCQALSRNARKAGIELIRYASVRDRPCGRNLAVLSCRAFAYREPQEFQSWKLLFIQDRVQAVREHPSGAHEWCIADFANDARIASLVTKPG